MSGIGTGYDLSTTTYSPDGKVFQVDYACKAVDNGGLALGVRCKDGVVLGVEKLLAMKMLVPGANRRIAAVDRHAGMAGTGLAPDARQIVAREIGVRSTSRSTATGSRRRSWRTAWRTTCTSSPCTGRCVRTERRR